MIRTGDLLGCVIVHELGHLLLGRDSHSATGLMSAVWQVNELRQASQGILFFTDNQQNRIRALPRSASSLQKSGEHVINRLRQIAAAKSARSVRTAGDRHTGAFLYASNAINLQI